MNAAVKASARMIWIPAIFWDDHSDRCPYDDPANMPEEIKRAGNRVQILASADGLRGLRNDAEFYADRDNMDDCPRCYVDSAKRTLAAIAKAQP